MTFVTERPSLATAAGNARLAVTVASKFSRTVRLPSEAVRCNGSRDRKRDLTKN
jgi:hypothetical protein